MTASLLRSTSAYEAEDLAAIVDPDGLDDLS